MPWYQVASNLDKDGRFRIEDVPPGRYQLRVRVFGVGGTGRGARRIEVGQARMNVAVPEVPGGRSNEPIDLGTIKASLHETLAAGDLAPDFTVRRIGGQADGGWLQLGDDQGKLVLIDFRTSQDDRTTRGELGELEEIQRTYGGDPRFRLITLWCDRTTEAAERIVREKKLSWTQGFDGDYGTSYKLRALPGVVPGRPGRPHPGQEPPGRRAQGGDRQGFEG